MPVDEDRVSLPARATAQKAAGRTTHRMLPEDQLRRRFDDRPAVADWILAVRHELHNKYGEVDTISKFARELKDGQLRCTAPLKNLRRRYSEQLTTAPGPSWQMAEYVLRHVVTDERRPEVQTEFADLYEVARGEPAPGKAGATAKPPGQADLPKVASPPEVDAATTGELRGLVTELQRTIRAAEAAAAQREAAAAEREKKLREALAARDAEAGQLRANLAALSLVTRRPAGPATRLAGLPMRGSARLLASRPPESPWNPPASSPRYREYGSVPSGPATSNRLPTSDPTDPSAVPGRVPVARRYTALAELDQQTPARSRTTSRDELEDWVTDLWADMRRHRRLNPGQVDSHFDTLAEELSRQRVGPAPISAVPAPTAAPGRRAWPRGQRGRHRPVPERVPRQWTSWGPRWFYGLFAGSPQPAWPPWP